MLDLASARRRRVPLKGDSAVTVPLDGAVTAFASDRINAVIAQRDAQELNALTRFIDFLGVENLNNSHATVFASKDGPIPKASLRDAVQSLLDSFFTENAAQLPLFGPARRALLEDLVQAAQLLRQVDGGNHVGLSLQALPYAPARGEFHQDAARVAIVTTYYGEGTQVAANRDVVDWQKSRPGTVVGFPESAVVPGATISAAPGDRVLLKGTRHAHCVTAAHRRWPSSASVHRGAQTPNRVVGVVYVRPF